MSLGAFIKLKWLSFWTFLPDTRKINDFSGIFKNVKCGPMRTDVNVDGGHLKISGLVVFISGELARIRLHERPVFNANFHSQLVQFRARSDYRTLLKQFPSLKDDMKCLQILLIYIYITIEYWLQIVRVYNHTTFA